MFHVGKCLKVTKMECWAQIGVNSHVFQIRGARLIWRQPRLVSWGQRSELNRAHVFHLWHSPCAWIKFSSLHFPTFVRQEAQLQVPARKQESNCWAPLVSAKWSFSNPGFLLRYHQPAHILLQVLSAFLDPPLECLAFLLILVDLAGSFRSLLDWSSDLDLILSVNSGKVLESESLYLKP